MNNRTIIIVWKWNQEVVPFGEHAAWHTPDGDCLVCTDKRREKDGQEALFNLIRTYRRDGPVLVFLHSTEPHSYSEADRLDLLNTLATPSTHQVRIHLFSGGKGPLYFGWHSKLGMLGIKGKFPKIVMNPSDTVFEEKKSNLLIEGENNKIRQAHFDYIWNVYWQNPQQLVYNLAEYFRLWTDVPELVEGEIDFLAHLQQNALLWQRLAYFAGQEVKKEVIIDHSLEEYNFDNYEFRLEYENPALWKQLRQARQTIKNILRPNAVKGGEEVQKIEEIFNALFNLFKNIAATSI